MIGSAVVTGGGSGIGRAVALALAEAGWHVAIAGRRREALEETRAQAGDGAILSVVADVTDEAAVQALFEAAAVAFGRIDLLFNNAGVFGRSAAVGETVLDDWRRVIETNVTGAFLCAREAFRRMAAQNPSGGRIINNGSISAHVPRPHAIAYTASKHALTGLTRALALEGRRLGIACGQVDVGNAATEMTHDFTGGALQADGSTAAEPVIDVARVAATVVQMAGLPLDTNVLFTTIMATAMPYVGRG